VAVGVTTRCHWGSMYRVLLLLLCPTDSLGRRFRMTCGETQQAAERKRDERSRNRRCLETSTRCGTRDVSGKSQEKWPPAAFSYVSMSLFSRSGFPSTIRTPRTVADRRGKKGREEHRSVPTRLDKVRGERKYIYISRRPPKRRASIRRGESQGHARRRASKQNSTARLLSRIRPPMIGRRRGAVRSLLPRFRRRVGASESRSPDRVAANHSRVPGGALFVITAARARSYVRFVVINTGVVVLGAASPHTPHTQTHTVGGRARAHARTLLRGHALPAAAAAVHFSLFVVVVVARHRDVAAARARQRVVRVSPAPRMSGSPPARAPGIRTAAPGVHNAISDEACAHARTRTYADDTAAHNKHTPVRPSVA
jgi:hypothetical protein